MTNISENQKISKKYTFDKYPHKTQVPVGFQKLRHDLQKIYRMPGTDFAHRCSRKRIINPLPGKQKKFVCLKIIPQDHCIPYRDEYPLA